MKTHFLAFLFLGQFLYAGSALAYGPVYWTLRSHAGQYPGIGTTGKGTIGSTLVRVSTQGIEFLRATPEGAVTKTLYPYSQIFRASEQVMPYSSRGSTGLILDDGTGYKLLVLLRHGHQQVIAVAALVEGFGTIEFSWNFASSEALERTLRNRNLTIDHPAKF